MFWGYKEMGDIHKLIGREVKIDNKEGEITKVLGTSFLKVEYFNINEGEITVSVDDIDKFLV